jgi:serine/threonine protein kinase
MTESADLLLGRYRLLDRIGRGGMGSVWRGQDEFLRRPVAVKVIHLLDELDADERIERYRRVMREARAAARLRHPGVVSVYDVVEQAGRPWIIMELVESRSLEEILKSEGPVPPKRAAQIGLGLLDALQAAHRAGVIHRDVKPGNVLVGAEGRIVLSDFGIATYDGASTLTRSGTFMGSPAYIAPEIANGRRATPASDLWSLGATLYAAVEGRPPYERDTIMATLGALLTQDPDPPKRAGPLRPVIEGLLRKQPAKRSSARRTRALLNRALDNNPRQPTRMTRQPLVLAGIVALIIGVTAGGVIAAATQDDPRRPPTTATSTTRSPTITQGSPRPSLPSKAEALVVRCRAPRCGIFISSSPNNRVLFNGHLAQGEARQADEQKMNLVVSDGSACDVYINGKLQEKGPPGKKKTFLVIKE